MIIQFLKGKRNHYKYIIGFHISKIEIPPFGNKKYRKGMRTINFRYKHNVYSIFLNWNKRKKSDIYCKI